MRKLLYNKNDILNVLPANSKFKDIKLDNELATIHDLLLRFPGIEIAIVCKKEDMQELKVTLAILVSPNGTVRHDSWRMQDGSVIRWISTDYMKHREERIRAYQLNYACIYDTDNEILVQEVITRVRAGRVNLDEFDKIIEPHIIDER